MNTFARARQRNSTHERAVRMHFSTVGSAELRILVALGGVAFVLVAVAVWFLSSGGSKPEGLSASLTAQPVNLPDPEPMLEPIASGEMPEPHATFAAPSMPVPPHPAALSLPKPPARAVTLAEIEAEYSKADTLEAREEAARSMASMDSPEAVASLSRLFAARSEYPDRVAIIGALDDCQSAAALEAKLGLLGRALAANQPREVRRAAIDAAAQLDDPRAIDLLRRAAKDDSDPQIRELASSVLPEQ
jgi:hypothetical protein